MQWVIDTWVIQKCNETDQATCLEAIQLLIRILNKDALCLDFEGEILAEYYGHIKPRTYVARWWEEMRRYTNKFAYFSGKLGRRHVLNLVTNLHFDRSDTKFVAVAHRTQDHLIVSEDSDYSTEVCDYLLSELSVKVLSLHNACMLS